MKSNTYQCDNCEKRRDQDSNHWFVLFAIPVEVPEALLDLRGPKIGAVIAPWDEDVALRPDVKHACGQECGFELLARRLGTGHFERRPVGAGEKS